MILLIFFLYHQAISLVIRENQANQNGLSSHQFNLSDYPELITQSHRLIVSVYLNIQSKNPGYLAYCTDEFLKESSNIFQNTENLKSYILKWQPNYHINSTEKSCIFDNQASIYGANSHSLTLIYENDHNDIRHSQSRLNWIQLSETTFTIYVYSELSINYELLVLLDEDPKCENQCNQNGSCLTSIIGNQVCQCQEQFIDNLCSYSAPNLTLDQKIKIQMKDNAQQYFQLSLKEWNLRNFKINFEVNDDLYIHHGCSSRFPQQIFSKDALIIQNQFSLKINQSSLVNCIEYTNKINEKYQVSLSPQYLIILENKSKQNRIIYMELTDDSQNESNFEMIIIIIISVLGLTIGLSIGIFVYRKCYIKKKQEIQEKQQVKKIKYSTYQEILQIYPGLQEIQQCSICLSKFDQENEISLTLCLHIFHRNCIHNWLKQQKKCPFCREYVNFTQIKNMQQFEQHLQLITQEQEEPQKKDIRLQRLEKLKVDQQHTV